MTPITERNEDIPINEQSFLMFLEWSQYEFKLEYYNFRMSNVIIMITIRKIALEYAQKEIIKEWKHFTIGKLAKFLQKRL